MITIDHVKEMLGRYYADTGESKEDTLADLQELQEEIEILMDALR